MISIGTNVIGYFVLMLSAALVGGLGGLGAELLQDWNGNTGTVEKPHPVDSTHSDLGWVASVILGAMAAIAILYFLPPQTVTTVQLDTGTTETTVQYDLIKLVALSLIAGAGGSVILKSLVDRLRALLEQERARLIMSSAHECVAQLPAQVTADLHDVLRTAIETQRVAARSRALQLSSKAAAATSPAGQVAVLQGQDDALVAQYTSDFEQALNQMGGEIERRFTERLQSRASSAEALLKTVEKQAPASRGGK